MKRVLTGIKPTGLPHIGNYFGAIKPALNLSKDYESFYFIADYHALTSIKDPKLMAEYSLQIAAAWLALGLDPEKTVFISNLISLKYMNYVGYYLALQRRVCQ